MSQTNTKYSSKTKTGDNIKVTLVKFIARHTDHSRRSAAKLIIDGRVKINNQIIDQLSYPVQTKDRISIDQKIIQTKSIECFAFYKPLGVLVSKFDPEGRTTIYDILPKKYHHLQPVGRLDINSEGLLLLTNDGDLSRHLELPTTGIKRRYKVRVFGVIKPEKLAKLCNTNIDVDGEKFHIDHIDISPNQQKQLEKQKTTNSAGNIWILVTLREGKNREIRKICDFIGLRVNRLIRIEFGGIQLGKMQEGDLVKIQECDIA